MGWADVHKSTCFPCPWSRRGSGGHVLARSEDSPAANWRVLFNGRYFRSPSTYGRAPVHSSPGQYLSAVSQDREVQMLPHIHKMISSNLPPSYHTTIHSLGLIVPSSVRIVTKTPDRVDSPASQRTQRLILLRERVDCWLSRAPTSTRDTRTHGTHAKKTSWSRTSCQCQADLTANRHSPHTCLPASCPLPLNERGPLRISHRIRNPLSQSQLQITRDISGGAMCLNRLVVR